jgi:hypothetical protein
LFNIQLVTVLERFSQCLQKFPNFAFNMSAGQPAEHPQILQFHCDADNVFLFEIQQSISLDGTLTFKPASNSFGQSNVIPNYLKSEDLLCELHPML